MKLFLIAFFSLSCATAKEFEYKDIHLLKNQTEDALEDQLIQVPQYLIITSDPEPPSKLFKKINRELKAPEMWEGCYRHHNDLKHFLNDVRGILPQETPLKVLKAFHIVKGNRAAQTALYNILHIFGWSGGWKGGKLTYYVVQDPKQRKYIVWSHLIFDEPTWLRYKGDEVSKARRILAKFPRPGEAKKVLISFNTWTECGGGIEKKNRTKPEMAILTARTLKFIDEWGHGYLFENPKAVNQFSQIELTIDDKSLGRLILNSAPLEITDISLL